MSGMICPRFSGISVRKTAASASGICYNTDMKTLSMMLAATVMAAAGAFADIAHSVTFRRLNGTVLQRIEVAHGGAVTAPAAPVETDFTFVEWDGAEKLACEFRNHTLHRRQFEPLDTASVERVANLG